MKGRKKEGRCPRVTREGGFLGPNSMRGDSGEKNKREKSWREEMEWD